MAGQTTVSAGGMSESRGFGYCAWRNETTAPVTVRARRASLHGHSEVSLAQSKHSVRAKFAGEHRRYL